MTAEYNTLASNQGLSPSEMHASVGNLLDPADPLPAAFHSEEWFGFDLAAVGFGFHHFEDLVLAASRLAERLKTGGVLLIIDFLPHGPFEARPDGDTGPSASHDQHGHGHGFAHGHGHGHEHGHGTTAGGYNEINDKSKVSETVKHLGFSEDTIRNVFEAAGVGKDFAYQKVAKGVVFTMKERTMTRNVFFARGTKV
jgi:SAM-dependent methyltransferase